MSRVKNRGAIWRIMRKVYNQKCWLGTDRGSIEKLARDGLRGDRPVNQPNDPACGRGRVFLLQKLCLVLLQDTAQAAGRDVLNLYISPEQYE
jgi:hypothetical protein